MYLPYDLASEVTKSNDFLQACMYRNRYGIFLLGCTGLEDCKVYLSAFKLSTLYSWKLLTIFISFQLKPQKLLLASLQPDFLCLEFCCDYHIVTFNVIWMTFNTQMQAFLFSLQIFDSHSIKELLIRAIFHKIMQV